MDFTADDLRNQLSSQCCQRTAGSLTLDDVNHLLADSSDLRRSCICSLLDLVWSALGEGNAEKSEEVVVSSLDGGVGLDQRLPLAHKRPKLVGCEVQSVEVCQAVLTLHLIDPKLNLAESMLFVLLEIGEGDFKDTTLQSIVGVLQTSCSVDECFADTVKTLDEIVGIVREVASYSRTLKVEGACSESMMVLCVDLFDAHLQVVPIFSGERILGSLLETFLTFRKALVPVIWSAKIIRKIRAQR